jgi:hypothetical protein
LHPLEKYGIFDTSCPCRAHTGRYVSLLLRLVFWHFLFIFRRFGGQ